MKNFLTIFLTFVVAAAFSAALYDTPYIGNSYRKTFHYRDCYSVFQMNPSNQVPLNSREEALQNGFRPCGNCKP